MTDNSGYLEQGRALAAKGSMLGLLFIATACSQPTTDFGHSLAVTEEIVQKLDHAKPVPTEILEGKFKTFIHNLPDIQLQIMPEALIEDPVFRRVMDDKNEELHIVLMDGSYLDARFLPTDLPSDDFVDLVQKINGSNEIDAERSKQYYELNQKWGQDFYQREIKGIEEDHANGQFTDEDVKEMKKLLDLYFAPFFGKLTDENLQGESIGSFSTIEAKPEWDGHPASPNKKYILLAVRENSRSLAFDKYLKIRFPEGITTEAEKNLPPDWNLRIHPDQSLRDPSSIKFDVGNKDYPITNSDLGTSLRHELGHAKGLKHPQTDFNTLLELKKAWGRYHIDEVWERHQKGDPSGYYFKFVTSEGDIYTQKPPLKNSPSIAARAHNIKGHTVADFKARAGAKTRLKI